MVAFREKTPFVASRSGERVTKRSGGGGWIVVTGWGDFTASRSKKCLDFNEHLKMHPSISWTLCFHELHLTRKKTSFSIEKCIFIHGWFSSVMLVVGGVTHVFLDPSLHQVKRGIHKPTDFLPKESQTWQSFTLIPIISLRLIISPYYIHQTPGKMTSPRKFLGISSTLHPVQPPSLHQEVPLRFPCQWYWCSHTWNGTQDRS